MHYNESESGTEDSSGKKSHVIWCEYWQDAGWQMENGVYLTHPTPHAFHL